MAFLVVAGQTVPVKLGSARREREEVGQRRRTFDGSQRSTVRARKRVWHVETHPMALADATSLLAVFDGSPPFTCSGDMIGGTLSCYVFDAAWQHLRAVDGERAEMQFTLAEA